MILFRVHLISGLRVYVFLAWVLFRCGSWLEDVPSINLATGVQRVIERRRNYRVALLGLVVQVSIPLVEVPR